MDRTTSQQWTIRDGAEVRSSDDEKLGKVISNDGSFLIVEKGFFFPTDYYVPTSAVSSVDGDTVYLSVTKDVALNSGWDQRGTSSDYETVGTTSVSESYDTVESTRATGTGTTRVPLYEEDLTATKRPVERGSVRIEKELVTEDRNITVPVTEERVRVTRVDAADATSPMSTEGAFRDEVIEVPVTGEEVYVQKTARLAGEVVVEKEAVQTDKRVGGTVRREEVHVDDSTETVRHDSNS